MAKYGVVVGKFDPLHTGHINLIQTVSGMFDKTVVVISHDDNTSSKLFEDSKLKRHLTGKDKLAIVQKTFQGQKDLIIPILVDETEVPDYPNGWSKWTELVKEEIYNNRRVKNEIRLENETIEEMFSRSEFIVNEEEDSNNYKKYFGCQSRTLDIDREEFPISATMIRNDPFELWDYVARASREFLTPRIAIVGGESSGKTTMTDKLANIYATTSVWEEGRLITDAELGGDESALQYKNYADISNRHFQSLKFAMIHAYRVLFSDTDFIATQAFCMTYEGKSHPVVQEMIESVPFDLTILLNNNVEWVDDGMRMLGEQKERNDFQSLLKALYKANQIPYIEISSSSFEKRYEICKAVTDKFLKTKTTVEELQELVNKMEKGEVVNGN